MLSHLQYSLHEIKLIRNQKVYSEGEASNHIYLIKEGDFLLTKTVPKATEMNVDVKNLIGPNQLSLKEHEKTDDMKVIHSALGDKGPKSAAFS